MRNENFNYKPYERHNRFWTGVAFIIIGGVLFGKKWGIDFPQWLFTWPMILILVGVVSGFKHRFQNMSWIILIGIGSIFLLDDVMTNWELRKYIWPMAFLGIGLLFILNPKKKYIGSWRYKVPGDFGMSGEETENSSAEDVINSTSVFGGVKKVITSKQFKGGSITCFMGGAEYNLTQSDISGTVIIDITQIFGGTKLIVPPHWDIRTESVAIFAGIEDKRPVQPGSFDPNKILILRGTSIFGGIEIRSY
jgi:predicted membrane protein